MRNDQSHCGDVARVSDGSGTLMATKPTILLTESRYEIAKFFEVALSCHGFGVEVTQNGTETLARLRQANGHISAALLDIQLPGKSGLGTLRDIRTENAFLPVVLYSQELSPTVELEARGVGATDFVTLPVSHADLAQTIHQHLPDGVGATGSRQGGIAVGEGADTFLCVNSRMQEIRVALGRLALTEVPVVFHGESGVGKEVLARSLHKWSGRAGKPFVKLNCAAVPSELLESELFGYERGAFTGAFKSTPGKFEQAEGGTFLLDEIGDLELKLQAKLLHVLQDREFQRLGGRDIVRVNVRVLAATHRDLETEICEGRFRADLYYRLNVIRVDIPPLRERTDEILPFVDVFMRKHAVPCARTRQVPASFQQALLSYDWPGNIRELENVIQRFLILQEPDLIARQLLEGMNRRKAFAALGRGAALGQPERSETRPELPVFEEVSETKAHIEEAVIRAALDVAHWNRKKAAQLLMMNYKALLYKMRRLDIFSETKTREAAA